MALLNSTRVAERGRSRTGRRNRSPMWRRPVYIYSDNLVLEIAVSIKLSARDEIEITDLDQAYLDHIALSVVIIGRGFARLDIGTHASLVEVSHVV
jgi:glucose-1-phosphate thymidylyltransferase